MNKLQALIIALLIIVFFEISRRANNEKEIKKRMKEIEKYTDEISYLNIYLKNNLTTANIEK